MIRRTVRFFDKDETATTVEDATTSYLRVTMESWPGEPDSLCVRMEVVERGRGCVRLSREQVLHIIAHLREGFNISKRELGMTAGVTP